LNLKLNTTSNHSRRIRENGTYLNSWGGNSSVDKVIRIHAGKLRNNPSVPGTGSTYYWPPNRPDKLQGLPSVILNEKRRILPGGKAAAA
jgi:hypothetical protein